MNILITDTSNSLGRYLSFKLESNNTVYGFTRDTLYLPDRSKTLEVIESIKPDLVIHTSFLEDIDFCEENESLAYTFNTIGSLNAAYPCSLLDIPIIYFSTSYVHEGTKITSYYETDECNPINIYGKTKLAGEKLIRTLCKKYFIIRTSWVFGGKDCFVKKVIDNSLAEIFMCTGEIGNPTYIEDLCNAVEKIMDSDLYGIYNCAASNPVSKVQWVKTIFEYKNIEKQILEIPSSFRGGQAPRPLNASLNTSLIKNCFDLELPDWKISLKEYIKDL